MVLKRLMRYLRLPQYTSTTHHKYPIPNTPGRLPLQNYGKSPTAVGPLLKSQNALSPKPQQTEGERKAGSGISAPFLASWLSLGDDRQEGARLHELVQVERAVVVLVHLVEDGAQLVDAEGRAHLAAEGKIRAR